MSGKVVLLNGCSSAGKTTLAQAFQQISSEPFQHLSLDQFRDGLPMSYRGLNSPYGDPGHLGLNVVPKQVDGQTLTYIEFGSHGEAVLGAMRQCVAIFSQQNLNVIVDDILLKSAYLEDYANLLDLHNTWVIKVDCDLDTLTKRENSRPGRFPGTAEAQLRTIHGYGLFYDLEIDTSAMTTYEGAQTLVERMHKKPTALFQFQANQN